jgi:hypothetical protein
LVGSRQVPAVAAAEPAVTVVAVVGSVLDAPFRNVVEVPVRFQPLALPLLSVGVNARFVVTLWLEPLSVRPGNAAVDGDVSASEPPERRSPRWDCV